MPTTKRTKTNIKNTSKRNNQRLGKISPSGDTECSDGTKTTTKGRGACSRHGGLKNKCRQVANLNDKDIFAVWYPVKDIYTDEKRFQNREEKFSSESVRKIKEGYDTNKLDPIKVWKDPKNNKVYVVSGHSRLEAHKQLGKEKIPVHFLQGDEATISRFGKREANRLADGEKLKEDLRAYKDNIEVDHWSQDKMKSFWGVKWNKYAAWIHLDPKGRFISILATEAKKSFPFIENKATWVGFLRRDYPQLTNYHENEMFEFLCVNEKTAETSKDDFILKVKYIVSDLYFDPEKPLLLDSNRKRGLDARADTGPARQRMKEIEREIAKLKKQRTEATTREEKAALKNEMDKLEREFLNLNNGIEKVVKEQQSLFGLPKRGRKKHTCSCQKRKKVTRKK